MGLRGNKGLEKIPPRGALCCVFLTKYYWGEQITNNEMDGVHGTYGEERRGEERRGEERRGDERR
jgi:hypothetical protein